MLKSDRWIRKMSLEHDMINPFSEKQVRRGRDFLRTVIATATICAWPTSSRFSPTSTPPLSTQSTLTSVRSSRSRRRCLYRSAEFFCLSALGRIFQDSAQRADHLRRQVAPTPAAASS